MRAMFPNAGTGHNCSIQPRVTYVIGDIPSDKDTEKTGWERALSRQPESVGERQFLLRDLFKNGFSPPGQYINATFSYHDKKDRRKAAG